jgi:ribosome-associated protein
LSELNTAGEHPGLSLARRLVEVLEDKKGEDILLLDLADVCSFTDYFVIATGISERTLRSLADEIRKKVKDEFEGLLGRQEGAPASGWVLLDYGDVIVHLFSAEMRRYYKLEQLWEAGRVLLRVQ